MQVRNRWDNSKTNKYIIAFEMPSLINYENANKLVICFRYIFLLSNIYLYLLLEALYWSSLFAERKDPIGVYIYAVFSKCGILQKGQFFCLLDI